MSSIRKSGKTGQRTHKERSQPASREHLGPLEKKKDYKVRADDYQKKRKQLKVLHQKALERNPDEFYFHMTNSHTQNGVHREKGPKETEDTILQKKLMETKDVRYIRYKLDMERKKIEKLQGELHMLGCAEMAPNKHIVFVDSDKEARNFNPVKYFNTHAAVLDRRFNRPKVDSLKTSPALASQSSAQLTATNRERNSRYAELEKRVSREKELTIVIEKMEAARNVAQTKGDRPKRVRKANPKRAPVYKWTSVRKR